MDDSGSHSLVAMLKNHHCGTVGCHEAAKGQRQRRHGRSDGRTDLTYGVRVYVVGGGETAQITGTGCKIQKVIMLLG